MDNAIGEEGAAALAGRWQSAHVSALLKSVVPGYPSAAALQLFEHPLVADATVIESIGHSTFVDHHPGRMTLLGEQSLPETRSRK
jgi:hypothetical protein